MGRGLMTNPPPTQLPFHPKFFTRKCHARDHHTATAASHHTRAWSSHIATSNKLSLRALPTPTLLPATSHRSAHCPQLTLPKQKAIALAPRVDSMLSLVTACGPIKDKLPLELKHSVLTHTLTIGIQFHVMHLLFCYFVTLSLCHFVTSSHYHFVTLPLCHFVS